MPEARRFDFSSAAGARAGEASLLPWLPVTLARRSLSVRADGLLDTGATVNVLPWRLGVELGAIWEDCRTTVSLAGNLNHLEARILTLDAAAGPFAPARLAFAWTRAVDVPLVLGQVNFFMEFDVCFHRSRRFFEVKPKP